MIVIKDEESAYQFSKAGRSPHRRRAAEYLDVDGRRVAYFESRLLKANSVPMIVVPGVVVSNEYRTDFDVPAVNVEPLADPAYRNKVRDAILANRKGNKVSAKNFTFW